MFTGIIEAIATVVEKSETTLMLSRPDIFDHLYIGQSVAVSGVCLSVIAFDDASMTFNVIPQTWNHTKLGLLTEKKTVNVERAMPANGRFDGHIVQGHSEGVGVVVGCSSSFWHFSSIPRPLPPKEEGELCLESKKDKVSYNRTRTNDSFMTDSPSPQERGLGGEEEEEQNTTQDIRLTIQLPPSLLKYVIPKGSITIDGVSLTVADMQDDLCTVALIPHTLQHTTLGRLQEGDQVNIETDIVGKYVESMIVGE